MGLSAEYGVVIAGGLTVFQRRLPLILEDAEIDRWQGCVRTGMGGALACAASVSHTVTGRSRLWQHR